MVNDGDLKRNNFLENLSESEKEIQKLDIYNLMFNKYEASFIDFKKNLKAKSDSELLNFNSSEMTRLLKELHSNKMSLYSHFNQNKNSLAVDGFISLVLFAPYFIFFNSDKFLSLLEENKVLKKDIEKYFIPLDQIENVMDEINSQNRFQIIDKSIALSIIEIYLRLKILNKLTERYGLISRAELGRFNEQTIVRHFLIRQNRANRENKSLKDLSVPENRLAMAKTLDRRYKLWMRNKKSKNEVFTFLDKEFYSFLNSYYQAIGVDSNKILDLQLELTDKERGPRKILGSLLSLSICDLNAEFGFGESMNHKGSKARNYFIYYPLLKLIAEEDIIVEEDYDNKPGEIKSFQVYFYNEILKKRLGLHNPIVFDDLLLNQKLNITYKRLVKK